MKYNEIIHVSDDFIPVFDLENEETDQYWPLFIPNDKFRDILSSVLDSLDPVKQKNVRRRAHPKKEAAVYTVTSFPPIV